MAVLYTTHYMEEAERLCDRVGIIDLGELKAEGTRRELVSLVGQRDRVVLALAGERRERGGARVPRRSRPCTTRARRTSSSSSSSTRRAGRCRRSSRPSPRPGASVRSVEVTEPNLEAVFLHLTGKALRD